MLANGGIVDQDLEQAKNIFARLAAANYPNAKESLAKVEEAITAKKQLRPKHLKNRKKSSIKMLLFPFRIVYSL
jgi:TPR repeat protein